MYPKKDLIDMLKEIDVEMDEKGSISIDSFTYIRIIACLEELYEIELPDEVFLRQITCLDDIIEILEESNILIESQS